MKRFYSGNMYVESGDGCLKLYTRHSTFITSVEFSGEVTQEIAEIACKFWMSGWKLGLDGVKDS